MLRLLYNLTATKNLGSDVWYPIPGWLRVYLRTMSPARQVVTYARLMKGRDLSKQVRNEVGCAESVTRILVTLFPYCRIMTGTATLFQYLNSSKHFVRSPIPCDGAVIIAATGTGNGSVKNGHVGVVDGKNVWNNNSVTGQWGSWYSIGAFKNRFETYGGMKVYYFVPITK